MTPEIKATKLISRFIKDGFTNNIAGNYELKIGIQCALICAKEIVAEMKKVTD